MKVFYFSPGWGMPAGVVGVAAGRPAPPLPLALCCLLSVPPLLLSLQLLLRPLQLHLLLLSLETQRLHCGQDRIEHRTHNMFHLRNFDTTSTANILMTNNFPYLADPPRWGIYY